MNKYIYSIFSYIKISVIVNVIVPHHFFKIIYFFNVIITETLNVVFVKTHV